MRLRVYLSILTTRKTMLNTKPFLKFSAVIATGVLLAACNQPSENAADAPVNLDDPDVKVSYAVGVSSGQAMARNLASLEGTGIGLDNDTLIRAFADGLKDASQLNEEELQATMNEFRARVNTVMQERRAKEQEEQAKIAEENKTNGAAFLEENKGKDGVVTLESGLQYKVLTEGKGATPGPTDRVKVHYSGTLIDGKKFDSSYDRGEPATFGVNQVIKGWTEALQLMKEGAKWQLFIPSELAYGPTARPTIPGNSVLLFDVELLEVVSEQSDSDDK